MPGASSNDADPDARHASSAAGCRDPGLARVGGGPVIEDRAGLGQRGRSRRRPGTADRASLWGNRVQLVAGLASVGVAAAYVALRFAYTRFYDTLGVAPEDLGLGKVDLLVRSAGLVLASALTGVVLLELAVFVVFLIVAAPVILKGTLDARPRLRRAWFTRGWKAGAVASVALVVALVTVGGPSVARLVEQGKAYRDWTVPWRADPATVTWLRQPPAGDPLSGRCVMYLGQANGIAVLYDVGSRRVVRVPSSEVVILIETSAHSCQGRT
jgi:hypothetical protein